MTKSHHFDYADVLSDLKAKRKELDKAIVSLEALGTMGLLAAASNDDEKIHAVNPTVVDLRGKGAYEAAAALLKNTDTAMKTTDIHKVLLDNGVIDKDTKLATLAATLYKAVKRKTDCKIKLSGRGEWRAK